ncbi:arsenate reductase (glutaredoxin) [Pseudoalteromonas sp. S16_S37]|uniref:arsenate reductase (glutaredoxin) n=1 Tax=Pseudoalteromonas sp. S16_S37 TaxID=2720228 RepID=UPI001681034A|nr:arsenate reductase (glutaredoxin) [Pseudoalteromonas sp. S16_S37]MBD1584548.1 arsenate reductase (glutaredoxin) [Pseudoalteromonas sp. S16_S37]
MSVTIYHNPRCSKSRETLALLEAQGVNAQVIEYLNNPMSLETLNELIQKLGFDSAHQLVRSKETLYKELGLSKETEESVLRQAMIDNPKLIERPVVVNQQKAALGRPPESVLNIL